MSITEHDMATTDPDVKDILILGDYGTVKTPTCGTAPKPILFYSFDKGKGSLAHIAGIKVVEILEADRRRPRAWDEFWAHFTGFLRDRKLTYKWPDGKEEPYKTVVLDPLTYLGRYCIYRSKAINGRVDGKAQFDDYDTLLTLLGDVITWLKAATDLYTVCTALLKTDKDEVSGEIINMPNILGSIRETIGADFDLVGFMHTTRQLDGSQKVMMKVTRAYREHGRIRLPLDMSRAIGAEVEPDICALLEKIGKPVVTSQSVGASAAVLPVSPPKPASPAGPRPTLSKPPAVSPAPVAQPVPRVAPTPAASSGTTKITPVKH